VSTQLILAFGAAVFFVLATIRVVRNGARIDPAARTWLLIATFFGLVSVWLWFEGQAG